MCLPGLRLFLEPNSFALYNVLNNHNSLRMKYNLPISPILLGGLGVVLVAGVGVGIWQYQVHQDSGTAVVASPSPSVSVSPEVPPTPTPSPSPSPTATIGSVSESDITWLSTPEKLADLHLFQVKSGQTSATEEQFQYYKVGTKGARSIILAQNLPEGPSPYRDGFLFLGPTGNETTYSIIISYNSELVRTYLNDRNNPDAITSLTSLVTTTASDIASLKLPGTFIQDGIQFNQAYEGYALFSSLTANSVSKSVYKETTWGSLYRVTQKTLDDATTVDLLILKRFDSTGQYFVAKPASFIKDDMIPSITWTGGTANTYSYRSDGGGSCGSASGTNITSSLSGWSKTGTASDGTAIYEPTSDQNVIILKWFELSGGKYYSSDGTEHTITYADFVKNHPIIAYTDSLGRKVVMRNTTYGPNAECGKPVVYLYPKQPTQVQVSVGAVFHKSIPASTGVWNVTAYPNGKLVSEDGQSYPYLYWSGQGKGFYPVITAGVIVPRDQVQTVLRQQLNQLGFTKQEAADFLEFWAPRMPNTAYTRLTWLGNKELDVLAPMTITPKPDTVIRTFLDFEGLETAASLTPQVLSAPARTGFTVMEWGGLLRKP